MYVWGMGSWHTVAERQELLSTSLSERCGPSCLSHLCYSDSPTVSPFIILYYIYSTTYLKVKLHGRIASKN